ncbi:MULTISPECIES: hypothetical protein [Methanobacterium]|jgi:hypothetical protein|uniref:Uncharacterized protein n=1 Tax=Methanobacterium bryantii TaxID=2161 RepID=A0A2A2H187_METBR|nr:MULTISPECIES: hypothetical protein [Methanobacterium]OEC86274.1 hypothetical protein A9507_11180 [Methanobacterium sp. A39]PAV03168.1 hypothetical protein ASJ80_07830 [Methanobacterium bryantii]
MNEKLMAVLVFVILGMVVLTYGYTQQGNYTKQNNTVQNATPNGTVQDNETNVDGARYNDVTITQKGLRTPQKRGTSVPIYYTVTNNGKNKVYGVEVWSQDFGKDIGTLDPGQTKKYTYMEYVPTDNDLASWYDSGVKLNSQYTIGGIYLSFKDSKGVIRRVQSNSIEIRLLN